MMSLFRLRALHSLGSLFLTLVIVGSIFIPFGSARHAEAQWAVIDLSNLAQNVIQIAWEKVVSGLTEKNYIKEYILDPIAWAMMDILIQEMTKSIVDWINSGFEGSPAFVRDFDGFMTKIADQAVGDFIWNNPNLNFLCSPFKLNLQVVLDIQYRKTRNFNPQCTLTGVVKNVDAFFKGDFLQGGWAGWFKVTQTPVNNPYGALLEAQIQMDAQLATAKGTQKTKLDWGKGFLTREECTPPSEGDSRKYCRTVTPGTTIEDSLNQALGNPARRIAVADEINEILGALFAQLARQALGGVGGLLGLTSGGVDAATGEPAPSYFDTLAEQPVGGDTTGSQNPINQSIDGHSAYTKALSDLISLIDSARTYKDSMYGDGNTCHSGELSPALLTEYTRLNTEYSSALTTESTLRSLLLEYEASVGTPDAPVTQSALMETYSALSASGKIKNTADAVTLEQSTKRTIEEMIQAFKTEVDAACFDPRGGGGGGDGS